MQKFKLSQFYKTKKEENHLKKKKCLSDKPTGPWKKPQTKIHLFFFPDSLMNTKGRQDENAHIGMFLQVVVTRKNTKRNDQIWIVIFFFWQWLDLWNVSLQRLTWWFRTLAAPQIATLATVLRVWRFAYPEVSPGLWVISLLGAAPPTSLHYSAKEKRRVHSQVYMFINLSQNLLWNATSVSGRN